MTAFGLVVVVLLGALVTAASLRRGTFRVSRETVIAAPPEAVFAQLDDLRRWSAWWPLALRDPDATLNFDGPERGVGASVAWSSLKIGFGRLTIRESVRDERLRVDMTKATKPPTKLAFDLEPSGEATHIRWTMSGEHDFFAKILGLFVNLERRIAADLDRGLSHIKGLLEQAPPRPDESAVAS